MKKISFIFTVVMILNLFSFGQITEYQKILADDGIAYDEFGSSVDISGSYAIIGAHNDNANADNSGCAYIFEANSGTWIQTAKLTADDGTADDEFGYSVAIDGDYAVVGAYKKNNSGTEQGGIYIYYKDQGGFNNWGQVASFTANDVIDYLYFGYSVAIAGDYIFVGAYNDEDNYQASGAVYVYHNNSGTWEFDTKLKSAYPKLNEKFGWAVAMDEDIAVVGSDKDSVFIFKNISGVWQQETVLFADDDSTSYHEYFGTAVDINGDNIIVGSHNDPYTEGGAAYIFYNNSGTWEQQAKLTGDDISPGDYFGFSVAITGDTVVIGAPRTDFNGTVSGSAYAFRKNGSNWEQFGKLLASDGSPEDRLGYSVAISGNSVVLGAYGDDDNGNKSGATYVYFLTEDPYIIGGPYDVTVSDGENATFKINVANVNAYQWQVDDGSGFTDITDNGIYSNSTTDKLKINGATLDMDGYLYRCVVSNDNSSLTSSSASLTVRDFSSPSIIIETQKILADDGIAHDHFGRSVAISGDYAIIGAHQDNSYPNSGGSAYIYKNNGTSWEQIKKITANDAEEDDEFGYSVAIYGDYVVVGSYKDNDNGTQSGSAYVFYKDEGGNDNWGQVAKLTASDGIDYHYFGYAVAIAGDYIMVGAYNDYDNNNASGAVYVFHNNSGTWEFDTKLKSTYPQLDEKFGWSVAMSGDVAIIGSNLDSAYIFRNNSGVWEQEAGIEADDNTVGEAEYFSISVGIDGDYAVVGAYHDPWPQCNGSAYVFHHSGSNWTQVAKLTANDAAEGDNFGRSVAISGDTVIVGSPRNNFNGTASGCAYVFIDDGSQWIQQAKMVASDGSPEDRLGYSVAISGNSVVLGAYGDDDNGSKSGAAYIFDNFENPYVSIKQITEQFNISVFPNPAKDYIFLNLPEKNQENYIVKIYDINGKCRYQNNHYKNLSKININGFIAGTYIVQVSSNKLNVNKIFIIE